MEKTHKYLEIKKYILDNIASGQFSIGDKIISESQLMKMFNVSRMTARQAIGELQNENILVTIKGKGTFVQSNDSTSNGAYFMSFSERANATNKNVTNKIIRFSQVRSDDAQNAIFSFSKSKPLWNICRIRYINNLLAAYEESYIPVEYIPTLTIENAQNSLYHFMDEKGVVVSHARQKTTAIIPSQTISEYLQLENTPIIKVTQKCYDVTNRCVELCHSYYHPENYNNSKLVVRKKYESSNSTHFTKILLISDHGIITSSLVEELNKYINQNNLSFKIDVVDFIKSETVIDSYDLVILEPRYKYALKELKERHSHIPISIIDMNDYALLNAKNIIKMINID